MRVGERTSERSSVQHPFRVFYFTLAFSTVEHTCAKHPKYTMEEDDPSTSMALVPWEPPDRVGEAYDTYKNVADILNLRFRRGPPNRELEDDDEDEEVNNCLRLQLLETTAKNDKLTEENNQLKREMDKLKEENAELENDLVIAEATINQAREEDRKILGVEGETVKKIVEERDQLKISLDKEMNERRILEEKVEKQEKSLREAEKIMKDLEDELPDNAGELKGKIKELEAKLEEESKQKDVQVKKYTKLSKSLFEFSRDLGSFVDQVKYSVENCANSDAVEEAIETLMTFKTSVSNRLEEYHNTNLDLKKEIIETNLKLNSVLSQLVQETEPSTPAPPPPAPSPAGLRKHKLIRSQLGTFTCTCDPESIFQTRIQAKAHLEVIKAIWNLTCYWCPARFQKIRKLKLHLRQTHRIVLKPVNFRCHKCPKRFKSESYLVQHHAFVHAASKYKKYFQNLRRGRTQPKRLPKRLHSSPPKRKIRKRPRPPQPREKPPVWSRPLPSSSSESNPEKSAPVLHPAVPHGFDPSKVYACVCTLQFKSERALSLHVAKDGAAEWKFRCDHCPQKFYIFKKLKEHHATSHQTLPGIGYVDGCCLCGTLYTSRTEYIKHLKDSHNVPVLFKTRPKIKIEPEEDRPAHAFDNSRAARKSGGFHCICGHKANYKQNLKTHINNHNTPPQLKCEMCTEAFRRHDLLKLHMMKAHGINWKKHGCGKCGLIVGTQEEMVEHRQTSHPIVKRTQCIDLTLDDAENALPTAATPSPNTTLPLPKLSPQITRAEALKITIKLPQHRKDETSQDIQCVCGGKFSSVVLLNRHIKMNTGQKLFDCNICQERFRRLNQLRTHMKTKHRVKKLPPLFGCGTCGSMYGTRSLLMKHQNERHPKATAKKKLLRANSKRHGIDWSKKDQGYYCVCGTKTTSKQKLHKHIDHFMGEGSSTPLHRSEPEPVPSTSRGPSIVIAARSDPVPSTSRGPSIVISTSRKLTPGPVLPEERPTSPTFGDLEAATPDMIIDAHLACEPVTTPSIHDVDKKMLFRRLFFCKCGQDFQNLQRLNNHVKYYSSKMKYVCKTCKQAFLGTGLLRSHMWRVHRVVLKEKNGCKTCGETFATTRELLAHRRSVHNIGLVPVGLAEVKHDPHRIEQPVRKDEPPPDAQHRIMPYDPSARRLEYKCKCGKTFKTRGNLQHHVRVILKLEIFSCPLCPVKKADHRVLKQHVEKVHNVKYDRGDYGCHQCGNTFQTRKQLGQHLKIHRSQLGK